MLHFEGTIFDKTLSSVLNFFRRGDYSGCLVIKRPGEQQGVIYIKGENITYANISTRRRRLGEILVERNLIKKSAINQVLKQMKAENYQRSFAAILRAQELVSEEMLLDTIKGEMGLIMKEVMNWNEGFFRFLEGRDVPKEYIPCELKINDVMQEYFMEDTGLPFFDTGQAMTDTSSSGSFGGEATFHQAEQHSLDILKPRQVEFTAHHKEQLFVIFQDMAENATQFMQAFITKNIKIRATSVYEMSYNQFLTIVASDHHHTLIELEPYVDFGLLSFHPETISVILNHLLSDQQSEQSSFIELSKIEEQLIDRTIEHLVEAFSQISQQHQKFFLRPYTRYRVDHHQHFSASLDSLIVGNFEWDFGEICTKAYLCLPRTAFEGLLI